MGQVWRARDPELDRDVAIKVLHPDVRDARGTEARERLRREAQAMAKLQHPNVIAVHEVGEAEGQIFVVMELVTGGTLRQWLARTSRSVAEIVDVFAQAGRGLAAAHAAGLVHRDFKPENVLVGDDGRVRVTDFGLVGAGEPGGDLRSHIESATSLTRTGTILGTPAYLAPEVLRGQPATVVSDQFSFCVALYEALWQQPPFPGETVQALFQSVTSGALAPIPRRPNVPATLRDAIVRGLAVERAARWPSMDALLATFRARAQPRWRFIGAAVLVAGGGIASIALRNGDGDDHTPSAPAPMRPVETAPVQLTNLGACSDYPVFADAATIVFDHYDGKNGDLFSVPVRGGTPVKLDKGDEDYEAPVTSGPGEVVAKRTAGAERILDRLRLDGTVTPFGSMPEKSADTRVAVVGDALYYLRKDNGQLRRRQGGLDVEVANLPADRRALNVAASPDGRWLVIGTARTVGRCIVDLEHAAAMSCVADPEARGMPMLLGDSQHYLVGRNEGLWKWRLDGTGTPVKVWSGRIDGLSRSISADGRALVYSSCLERSRLSVRSADGTVRDVLDGRHLELTARRDGALAMVRYVGAEESLIAMRTPAGELREVTPRDQLVREPSWSVDGRSVVYRVAGKGGGIYVVDVSPLPPRRVSEQTTDMAPVYLADGRIAVARYEEDQIARLWVLDPATNLATRVHNRAAWPYDRHPETGQVLVGDLSRHRMWLWDPATGAETEVARGDRSAADYASFTRDGRHLLVTWGNELWRLSLHGEPPERLHTAPAGIESLGRAAELPDGSITFTQHVRAGDIYRLDLPAY